ncbi:MAG: Male sterility protein [Candidatus Brocadiaceae bacterium]|nr:Male sterility protein [Candidatus Brocadiaceae bacterium]
MKSCDDKCCVVTGATGWLGRHIIQELDKLASGIFVLLRRKNGISASERCKELEQQTGVKSKLILLEIIDNRLPDIPPETTHIIHCAAMVDFSDNDTIFQTNVGLTWDLLVAASQLEQLQIS